MDDPKAKHEDAWFVSSQPHEVKYFTEQIEKAHPDKTKTQVAKAIEKAKAKIQPSEGRAKLTTEVHRQLK